MVVSRQVQPLSYSAINSFFKGALAKMHGSCSLVVQSGLSAAWYIAAAL